MMRFSHSKRALLFITLALTGLLPQFAFADRSENETAYSSILQVLATSFNQPDSPSSYKRTYKELERSKDTLLDQADLPSQSLLTVLQEKFKGLGLSHLRVYPLQETSQTSPAEPQIGFLGYTSEPISGMICEGVEGSQHTGQNSQNHSECGPRLVTLIRGGPAQAAGLEIGDMILESKSINRFVGSVASLKVRKRNGREVELKLTFAAREQIDYTYSYPVNLPNGKTATVLIINSFSEDYDAKIVEKAMAEANRNGHLIVDLRGNTGGRSEDFKKYFLKNGSHLYTYLEASEKEKVWDWPGLAMAKLLGISHSMDWNKIMPSQVLRKAKLQFLEGFRSHLIEKIEESWQRMLQEFEMHQASTHEYSEEQRRELHSHFNKNKTQLLTAIQTQTSKIHWDEILHEDADEDDLKAAFLAAFGAVSKVLRDQRAQLDQITASHYPPHKRKITLDISSLSTINCDWKVKPEANTPFEPFQGKVCFVADGSTYCAAQTAVHTLLEYQGARTSHDARERELSKALYPEAVHLVGNTGARAQGSICKDILNQYRLCYPLGDILSPLKNLNLDQLPTTETAYQPAPGMQPQIPPGIPPGIPVDEAMARAVHLLSTDGK